MLITMKAIAPGKIILSGEHSVVYGKPALVTAVNRSAQAIITSENTGMVSFDLLDLKESQSFTIRALQELKSRIAKNYHMFLNGKLGIRDVLHKPIDLFEFAFITVLDGLHLKLGSGVNIRLHSNIPIGCGMGSSAATILSVLRAAGHYFRVDFRPDWYYRYSLEAENLQHGHSSGVDPYISLYGGCVRFQQGQAEKLPLPQNIMYLVNTGTPTTSTGECVATVSTQFGETHSVWNDFETTTNKLENAFADNNTKAIRAGVRDNQRLLEYIGVVPERVQSFVRDIEQAGGAAKICGAGATEGDIGGMVIVFSDQPPHAICEKYGYEVMSIRGEPLGARIV